MKVSATELPFFDVDADAVVIGVGQISGDESTWEPILGVLNQRTGGQLAHLVASEDFTGKLFSHAKFYLGKECKATVVMLVGMDGEEAHPQRRSLEIAGYAAKKLASKPYQRIAYYLPVQSTAAAICGAIIGGQGQDLLKQSPTMQPPKEIVFYSASKEELAEGEALGKGMSWTRWLVNQPASEIYPESFVAEVQKEFEGQPNVTIEAWDENKLAEEKCETILAVGKGSSRPPRLLKVIYQGDPSSDKTLGFVGKGVTFDSGGLSLKPSDGMLDMKCDMAGAATVVGAIKAIAALKLPVNVTGYCGLAENMVAGNCLKLGDVIKTRSGTTVEVLNTDAEGRLVLADVLSVANTDGVAQIVDLATLTGACMVALGRTIAGVMSNDQDWCGTLLKAADTTGEYAWQLPMYSLFNSQINSKVADIKNVGDGRWGGAITAGKFLERFVDDTPWVHIDIAGPAFGDRAAEWIDAGASGCFVRTLVCLAENYKAG